MAKQKYDKSDGINGVLFTPSSTWNCPSEFPNLTGVKRIAIDIESKDPDLKSRGPGFIRGDASVAGIALATDDRSWYFPLGHLGGGNLDHGMVSRYFKDILSNNSLWVVGANLPYELEGLSTLGISIKGKLIDIQLIEPLLDEERDDGYSLQDLCRLHLGEQKDERLLREAASAHGIDPKGGLWKLHPKYVGQYAEYDASSCLRVLDKQMAQIKEHKLEEILELESKLLPVLHDMRMQGICIDLEAAEKLSKRLRVEEDKMRMDMIRKYNRDIDVWSGPQIASMCDSLSINYPRTAKDNPSFEGKWLSEHTHEFIEMIADLREINRLRGTFIDSWIFKNQVKGKIHPQWKQLVSDEGGTRTGRMACSNPNAQQIPAAMKRSGKPNPIGAEIRALFVPEKGLKWFKSDYSQQEPRILTHFASKCGFTGAELAAMAYRNNPKMDFYNFMMECAGIERRPAKDMYLGRCYGMGKKKLAAKLNKSVDECEAILRNFDEKVPFVKEIADRCMHLAQTRGYIKTLCGRKRHFNYWEPSDAYQMRQNHEDTRPRQLAEAQDKWKGKLLVRADTHKALNALIQGSAADMMKAAIVKGYYEDGRIPYITVHDEIGGGVVDEEDAAKWKHTMENCVDVCVPINAEIYVGKSWK